MIAEGMRISSVSRVKGVKEDTISDRIRSAAAGSPMGTKRWKRSCPQRMG
jgi:hypothetical protein